MIISLYTLREHGKQLFFPKKGDENFHVNNISIIQMNVQCSSCTHKEALHAQLQMDIFRFVNYQKFVKKTCYSTNRGSKRQNNFERGAKQFLGVTW